MTTISTATTLISPVESLSILLRALRLPTFARYAGEIANKAEREGWTFGQYLHHLAELEVEERRRGRLERFLKQSDLPREKTLATLTRSRLPADGARVGQGGHPPRPPTDPDVRN